MKPLVPQIPPKNDDATPARPSFDYEFHSSLAWIAGCYSVYLAVRTAELFPACCGIAFITGSVSLSALVAVKSWRRAQTEYKARQFDLVRSISEIANDDRVESFGRSVNRD